MLVKCADWIGKYGDGLAEERQAVLARNMAELLVGGRQLEL